MKLPALDGMIRTNSTVDVAMGTSQTNGKTSTKSGRISSLSGKKRVKGESIADAVAAVTGQNGRLSAEPSTRYNTMKKVAEEQRKKVREIRGKQLDEVKQNQQMKRHEELRFQIRSILDGMLLDVKREVFVILDEKISEERNNIKDSLKKDLLHGDDEETANAALRKLSGGEPFETRISNFKKEWEKNFNKTLQSEVMAVKEEVVSDVNRKLEVEKQKWEDSFKRDITKKVRSTEEAIRSDFRVGMEDSQKQCNDVIYSMKKRTESLEQKVTDRIAVMDAEANTRIEESERITCQMIGEKLDEREKVMKTFFQAETDGLRNEIAQIHKDMSRLRSRCCVII